MKIELGMHRLNIPLKNVRDPHTFPWLRALGGLVPRNKAAHLLLEAEDVVSEVAGYQAHDGQIENNLHLLIKVLGEAELSAYVDPQRPLYSELWFATGRFDDRVVDRHEMSGFYKVYNKDFERLWTAVKIYPDSTKPLPSDLFSFWIASCHDMSDPGTLALQSHPTICSAYLVYEGLLFDFSVAEENLHLVDGLKAMLVRCFNSWKEQP